MNMVERMAILSDEDVISLKDLPPGVKEKSRISLYGELGESLPLKEALSKFEEEIIREAISTHGTISKAAQILRVNQSTISRKVKKYNITHY